MKKTNASVSTIDRNLAFSFGGLVLALMVIVSTVSAMSYWRIQVDAEDRLTRTITSILGNAISQISFSGKHHSRLLVEKMIRETPELAYISIESTDGRIIAHSDPANNDRVAWTRMPAEVAAVLEKKETLITEREVGGALVKEVTVPYFGGYGNRLLGTVRVGVPVEKTREAQSRTLMAHIVLIIVLTALAMISIYFLSNRFGARVKAMAQQLEGILEYAPLLVDIRDRAGRSHGHSRLLERVLGRRDEMEGPYDLIGDRLDPEAARRIKTLDHRVLTERSHVETQLDLEIDGKHHAWLVSAFPISVDPDGRVSQTCTIALDITERKQAEEALHESERQKKLILDTLPDLVWLKDVDGVYRACNPVFERFFGAKEAEIVGKTDYDFVAADLADFFRRHDRVAMEAGGPSVNEERITFADDGHEALLETIKTPLKADDGEILGVLGIGRDITERKKAVEALREKNTELERSNAELESFAYIASHDLREPLRNVTNFSTLLSRKLEDRLDDTEKDYFKFIYDGATRMDQLVRDLLDFSRVGRLCEPMAQVPVHAVLEAALSHLRSQIEETGAVVEIAPDLPVVEASRDELERVFLNLFGNALKYRFPDRPPRISVGFVREGAKWRFHVSDNGIGIERNEGYEERVFRLFQRLHQRDEYGGGTGVGLAVCKKIVEHHGGSIWVESVPGQGSSFYFTLPAAGTET